MFWMIDDADGKAQDYIDSGLTSFLKQVIDTYSTLDWAMDTAVGLSSLLPCRPDWLTQTVIAVWLCVL